MEVFPFPTAVTRPLLLTVATPVFEDCQVTVSPVSTWPPESATVAVNWTVAPIEARGAEAPDTVTDPTVTGPSESAPPPHAAIQRPTKRRDETSSIRPNSAEFTRPTPLFRVELETWGWRTDPTGFMEPSGQSQGDSGA
jgi:hypothetical protein